MFRSVRFYSLVSPWPESEQELSEKLFNAAFKPCGPYVERSSGFEPPVGERLGLLARRVGGADLLRLRSQVRVLPAAALNEALEVRLDEYRARMQEEPGRRTKRQLKEQTRDELLPKALVKSERTNALVILAERVLAVDTASETRAERFLEQLRAGLGGLEVKPLEFKRPFGEHLTQVFRGDAPREFILARECRMRELTDEKGTVRWQNVDLAHSTVRQCLADGMELTHLAFQFGNVMSGVLDANGVLSKLSLLGVEDAPKAATPEEKLAEQDAEIALLSGTLRQLIVGLRRSLGSDAAANDSAANGAPARRPTGHQVIGTAATPAALGNESAGQTPVELETALIDDEDAAAAAGGARPAELRTGS
jgi:recombination associated protein RdgC